jgi:hypothetical protein
MATLKVRPNGDSVWARTYSSPEGDDNATALAVDAGGAVIVTGYGAGAGTHYDCTTVRYDSSGQELWSARYDGPNHGDDRAYDLAVDVSGNTIVTGHTDNGYATPFDYLTIRYNPSGETLWTRRYDGPAHAEDDAVAVAFDGGARIFVAGTSAGQGTDYDYATVVYSAAGEALWTRRYNGPANGQDQARALAVGDGAYVCVTGESYGGLNTGGDCATVMYDTLGETLWVQRFSTSGRRADRGTCVAMDKSGSVYVAGECDAFISGGDMVVIKYVENGGVAERSEPVLQQLAAVAVPNPFEARTQIKFELPQGGPALVGVHNVSGRMVRTLQQGQSAAGRHSVVWDGTDNQGTRVPAGVYMLVLEACRQRAQVKVVMSE